MHQAVKVLLIEGGLASVTVPAVAARSGVHHTSIYRRWGTVQNLLLDVILANVTRAVPTPDTGSLRGDVRQFARDAAHAFQDPLRAALAQAIFALPADDGTIRRRYWARRYETLRPMFDRAERRGETPPSPQDVVERILAPLYFRRFVTGRPVTNRFLDGLVDDALRTTAR
ncbi:TetR/AcrR family transcriptional regulator C-terminal ligand-binding domain-containing protein [Actinomadura madurae]|uniref:TetR-like C-terminal domain-containing protein n=1 Tax=Actinomadura madurae TaxID=1993 RepID=UPI0003AD2D15|nr:TetR-like C-terminal domain-containing protein [Actinomadura madurae]